MVRSCLNSFVYFFIFFIHSSLRGALLRSNPLIFFICFFFVCFPLFAKDKVNPIIGPAVLTPTAQYFSANFQDLWIEVQIPARRLLLIRQNKIVHEFLIAVGTPQFQTPVGQKKISQIIWNPWWYPPQTSVWVTDATPVPPHAPKNPLGPLKMSLGGDYLIHGTSDMESLGEWASHGCVRMMSEDLITLVEALQKNNGDQEPLVSLQKANEKPSQEFTIALKTPIPVVLTYQPVFLYNLNGENFISISPDIYNKTEGLEKEVAAVLNPLLKLGDQLRTRKIHNLIKRFHDVHHTTFVVPAEKLLVHSK